MLENITRTQEPKMTLQEQLNAMKEEARGKMSAEIRAIMARALEQLKATGQLQRALGPGAMMPEFALEAPDGKLFRSQELLQRGPLVVNFYRGSW